MQLPPYRLYFRGWEFVDWEAYEDAIYLDEWLGAKHPGLHKYFLKVQLRYLQQRIDGAC